MIYPENRVPPGDRFRVLFEHSSDPHIIFDETGITDCNDATIKLLKATDRAQVLLLHPAALSPEYQQDGTLSSEKSKEMDARARAYGYHRFEWLHRKVDGEVFPAEVTLNAVEIGGNPAMIVVWHDLTHIKQVEADLRRRSESLEKLNRDLAETNARLKRDLRAAAKIQQALLPTVLPNIAPVHIAWTFRPSEELAGDLLNIFLIDERHVGLYVLDVSGHGVAASLLSVSVSHFLTPHGDTSLLRVAADGDSPARLAKPGEVLRRLNTRFCPECNEQFFTLFYGILDLESLRLRYANGGHPPPVILSAGAEPRVLREAGLPVGIMDDCDYQDAEVSLRPGDRFWLYSDGLPEAMSSSRELFDNDRLLVAFHAAHTNSLSEAIRRVLGEVETWTGERGPQDDISLIGLEIGRADARKL